MDLEKAYSVLHEVNLSGMYRVSVGIPGIRPVLRVLSDQEIDAMMDATESWVSMESRLVAQALVSVAGYPVPMDPLARMLMAESLDEALPNELMQRLSNAYLRSSGKVRDSFRYLEGYFNTDSSRRLWASRRGLQNPFSYTVTGVPGSDQIPMLQCQNYWVSWNRSKDDEDRKRWENQMAIIAMSGTAPKAVKQHFDKEERRKEHEEEERRTLVRNGSREIIAKKARVEDGWATDLNTTEELMEQFRKMLAGEKDRHDLVVEQHFRDMREKARLEEEAAQENARRLAEQAERNRQELAKNRQAPTERKLVSLTDKQMRDNNLIRRVGRPLG